MHMMMICIDGDHNVSMLEFKAHEHKSSLVLIVVYHQKSQGISAFRRLYFHCEQNKPSYYETYIPYISRCIPFFLSSQLHIQKNQVGDRNVLSPQLPLIALISIFFSCRLFHLCIMNFEEIKLGSLQLSSLSLQLSSLSN